MVRIDANTFWWTFRRGASARKAFWMFQESTIQSSLPLLEQWFYLAKMHLGWGKPRQPRMGRFFIVEVEKLFEPDGSFMLIFKEAGVGCVVLQRAELGL